MEDRPFIGFGVFVANGNGKFLVGKRTKKHGGIWGLPGGHLEKGETFQEACSREVMEETGLKIGPITKIDFRNTFPESGKHYVTLFFGAKMAGGKLKNKEPGTHEEWGWFHLKDFPEPMFKTLRKVIQETLGIT